MKSKVVVVGNLNDCQHAFQEIDMDLVNSLIFATPEMDKNEWFSDKIRININEVKGVDYDWIFISNPMFHEFMELRDQLINLGVDDEKIWYNFDINTFNLRLKGFTNYNSGILRYKNDYFMKGKPTPHELESNLDFDSMNKLEEFFYGNKGKTIHKWLHYFEIYHKHFSKFVGKKVTVLEIGVFEGGSLELWRDYFGDKCKVYGIDINPDCKNHESEQIEILIGSSEDREFLRSVKDKISEIDIFIDDGGHNMNQQIVAFEELYPIISPDGVYLCEDLLTSYWEEYGGGYKRENTFIEYSKNLIDYLNAWHSREKEKFDVNEFTLSTHSMHYYDGVLVIEKRRINPPFAAMI